MTVRVVVADDHAVVVQGVRALLSAVEGMELVGAADTGRAAVRAAVTLNPDVLVLDLQMPEMGGLEAIREIGRRAPSVAVLVLTMFDDDDSVFAAMRAGALGYVLKGAAPDSVVRAIAAVAAGEAVFGAGVARRALDQLGRDRAGPDVLPDLTPRERQVLELVATGLSNPAIATRLGMATHTVGNHITSIFAKLQVASRAEAIVRARTAGLG